MIAIYLFQIQLWGGSVGILKGMLFTYLKYNCEEGSVGFLKGSLFVYLKYNCEGGSLGFLKGLLFIYLSTIVREEA